MWDNSDLINELCFLCETNSVQPCRPDKTLWNIMIIWLATLAIVCFTPAFGMQVFVFVFTRKKDDWKSLSSNPILNIWNTVKSLQECRTDRECGRLEVDCILIIIVTIIIIVINMHCLHNIGKATETRVMVYRHPPFFLLLFLSALVFVESCLLMWGIP